MKTYLLLSIIVFAGCAKSKNSGGDSQVLAAAAGHLLESCGPPVSRACNSPQALANSSGLPLCDASQLQGAPCQQPEGTQICVVETGFQCPSPNFSQGPSFLVCTTQQFFNCPISSAKAKDNIRYVTARDRNRMTQEILGLKLAEYSYKPGFAPNKNTHLGFIIEDLPPASPLVTDSRGQVNLYGYISAVVATVQNQERTIQELKNEIRGLKKKLQENP